jgi:hypothetical protein
MKKWLVLVWLLVPVALVSYHFGPGQEALAWRDARSHLEEARQFEKQGQWEHAVEAYQHALSALPAHANPTPEETAARDQLRLAQIRANFELGHLVESIDELRLLAEDVQQTHGADSPLLQDVRDLLGRVHFQAMIALRLESAEEEVWKRHWELSRQNFRFLAERTTGLRNRLDRQNLEAVIKSADLPTEAFAAPSGSGTGAGGLAVATATTPVTGNAQAKATDNRPFTKQNRLAPVDPPEFELGN